MPQYGVDKALTIEQIIRDYSLLENGTVLAVLDVVWDGFADKAQVYPRLQEWYVRRTVLDNVLGGKWKDFVDWEQAGVSEKQGGAAKSLQSIRDDANNEIRRLESVATASRGGVIGTMNNAPAVQCPGALDATWPGGPRFGRW